MVRYENPDGTFTNYETVESVKKNDGETFSWSSPETDAFQAKNLNYTVNGGKVNKVDVMRKVYKLDINGIFEDNIYPNTNTYGTFDFYINGKLQPIHTDIYTDVRYGSEYEIKNIKTINEFKYKGIRTKTLSTRGVSILKSAKGTIDFDIIEKEFPSTKSSTFYLILEFEKP